MSRVLSRIAHQRNRLLLLLGLGAVAMLWTVSCSDDTPIAPVDVQPPAAVTDLAVADSSESTIVLQWTSPIDPPARRAVSAYELKAWREGGSWNSAGALPHVPSPETPGSMQTFTVSELEPATIYSFQIRSRDSAGNWSTLSNEARSATKAVRDSIAPQAILDLMATEPTAESLTLHWTAPSDPPNSEAASRYELRFWSDSGSWESGTPVEDLPLPAVPGATEYVVLSGLAPLSQYNFQIRSADAAGNESDLSNPTAAWTGARDTPCMPSGFVATDASLESGARPTSDLFPLEYDFAATDSCPHVNIAPLPPYWSPVWHPSGEMIAMNYTPLVQIEFPFGPNCPGEQIFNSHQMGFWTMAPDGSLLSRVLPTWIDSPDWSPDGTWLTFSNASIYTIRFDAGCFDVSTLTQLTFSERSFFPAWSPDGERIAFDTSAAPASIYTMNRDGTNRRFIAHGRMPDWAPDGNHLVFVDIGNVDLFYVDTNPPGPPIQLTHYRETGTATDNRCPRYSPDGSVIAFVSGTSHTIPNVWLIQADGTGLRQLTTDGVDANGGTLFSWSPDGADIVYSSFRINDWTFDNGTLWTVNAHTGERSQITHSRPVVGRHARRAPVQ